ncbi:MAG: 2,4-dienoyl-CoA reductase (NADPH2), partial [Limisphaerales bacterium]
CLVNPRACHETELNFEPTKNKKKIAVVGAGPAGLAASTVAAGRGHEVHLFESEPIIGGQFNMAKVIPGKEDYAETLKYYGRQIEVTGVVLHLNKRATVDDLKDFDEVILATGVIPRKVDFEGADHAKVLDYVDVLYRAKEVGKSVAIIGAGGIGFDVAEFLAHQGQSPSLHTEKYMEEWGVDMNYSVGGALSKPAPAPSPRTIYLCKRSTGKHGKNLGRTTGWIHRASLFMKEVNMIGNAQYLKVDDQGFHISVDGETQILDVDHVIICAGQEPLAELYDGLKTAGGNVHLIGGAEKATELDAKRAIKQASYLAAEL